MKKMRRFLSLLICMVMLVGVLPLSAAAADHKGPHTYYGSSWIPDGAVGHYRYCTKEGGCGHIDRQDHNFYKGPVPGGYADGTKCVVCGYVKQFYTITFKNGDTVMKEISGEAGTSVSGAPSLPTEKAGYQAPAWDKSIPETYTESMTISVVWTPIKYDIEYVTDGGTLPDDAPVEYTIENAVTLPEPTKTGHSFDGWYDNADFTGSAVSGIKKGNTGTKTFYAKWTVNQYTITFMDGEEKIDEITLNYGEAVTGVPELTDETGYTVTWDQEIPSTMPAENKTIYVKRTIKQYTITFVNDGTEMDTITGNYGTDVDATEVPPLPTKDGYTSAWSVEEIPAKHTENVTISVVWTPIEYDIDYDLKGHGTLPENAPEKYTTEDAITLPVLADLDDEGYEFDGWYDKDGNKVTEIPKGSTGDKEFTAKWNSFVASIDVTPKDQKVEKGTTLQYSADVVAGEGCNTKVVWSIKSAEEGIALMSEDAPTTSIDENGLLTANKPGKYIVTATSVVNEKVFASTNVEVLEVYTINYNLDDGTATNPKTYTVETLDFTLNNPTKTGYTFAGWTGTGLDKATMEVTIAKGSTGNREYTATWTKNTVPVTTYKVRFDANGGTGTMTDVDVPAGTYTLPTCGFTAPSGKVFKCWRVNGQDYKPGEAIPVNGEVAVNGVVKVQAKWTTKTVASDLDYVPAAGDNFPTFLWAGLLLFSVIALAEVVSIRRKRS